MNLLVEHIGDLFIMLSLLFGFILIVYVNVEYMPDEDRNDWLLYWYSKVMGISHSSISQDGITCVHDPIKEACDAA